MTTTSVILPTCNRLKMLVECLKSLWCTTRDEIIETIVIVDNDPITYERLKHRFPIDVLLYNEDRLGAIRSWNKGLQYATGDMIHPTNDDVIYEKDWLKIALDAHQKELDGYGFVALNSQVHDLEIQSGGMLYDRKFCKEVLGGVVFCPYYYHLFADKEVDLRAKKANRFYPCYEAVAIHNHSSTGRRPLDDNDKWRDKFWPYDEAIYNARLTAGFPDDFEAVI